MKSRGKRRLKRGLIAVLTLGMVLGPVSTGGASLVARAARGILFSHVYGAGQEGGQCLWRSDMEFLHGRYRGCRERSWDEIPCGGQ